MILWISVALAHPQAGDPVADPWAAGVGMRTMLRVGAVEIGVTMIAEIPARRYAEESGADPEAHRRDLLAGLALYDGAERLALTAEPLDGQVAVRPSAERAITEVEVRGRAAWDGEGDLRFENGNYPDVPCLVATAVEVDGSRVVTETSLLEVHAGQVRRNRNGAWLRDEDGRRVDLRVRPAGWRERAGGMQALPARMAGVAAPAIPKIAWVIPAILLSALALFSRGIAFFQPPGRA